MKLCLALLDFFREALVFIQDTITNLYKVLIFLILALATSVLFQTCTNPSAKETEVTLFPQGRQLSEIYCLSCHLHPTPETLDRLSWEKVLLQMKTELDNSGVKLEEEDWIEIQQYYLFNAPEQLSQPPNKPNISTRAKFEPLFDSFTDSDHKLHITSIDSDAATNRVYIGNLEGKLSVYHRQQMVKVYQLKNIPIQVLHDADHHQTEVLGIGSFTPSQDKTGQLLAISHEGKVRVLIDSLQRPVHFLKTDLEQDGENEYIVSSFGSTQGKINSGKLSLFTLAHGDYQEKIIKESPGATKSAVIDFNQDGLKDIIALFSQGKEALYLFINNGNGLFEEKVIQEFNPVYGTNDFQLVDVNLDASPDIILTNGDNGDNSPVFKFYHGVRILLNDGHYNFKESYFYPLNGASRIAADDFDADGDMDFAVLSMYPDLIRWKNESLVYFENLGNLTFNPQFIEHEASSRWILMDTADIDSDGDADLILGANTRIRGILTPPRIQKQWNSNNRSIGIFTNMN